MVDRIVEAHDALAKFWSNPRGWAPEPAADLLARCRLDRQTQLARCLRLWAKQHEPAAEDGEIILGWANLGALVEGTLQLALSVYHVDYSRSDNAVRRRRVVAAAPELMLKELETFFREVFWTEYEAARWSPWVENVRERRNAVHAFMDRDVGTRDELERAIREYLAFLAEINSRLPYPSW